MLDNYLQQMTFSDAFFLGALRVKQVFKVQAIKIPLYYNIYLYPHRVQADQVLHCFTLLHYILHTISDSQRDSYKF